MRSFLVLACAALPFGAIAASCSGDSGPTNVYDPFGNMGGSGYSLGGADGSEGSGTGRGLDQFTDQFDPNEVYIIGTATDPGFNDCNRDVVSDFETAIESATMGFRCSHYLGVNAEGQLVYQLTEVGYEREYFLFKGDGLIKSAGYAGYDYPLGPQNNDTSLGMSCAAAGEAWLSPETGDILEYCCPEEGDCSYSWLDGTAAGYDLGTFKPFQLGYSGSAWLKDGDNSAILTPDGNVVRLRLDIPPHAVRSHSEGFRFLEIDATSPVPQIVRLYNVDFEGRIEEIGQYPDPPDFYEHYNPFDSRYNCALDSDDNYYCRGVDVNAQARGDRVIRAELDGEVTVVFSADGAADLEAELEMKNPDLDSSIHQIIGWRIASRLITAP